MSRPSRIVLGVAVVAAALALAGCAGSGSPKPTASHSPSATSAVTQPSPTPTSTAHADEKPTCDGILDPDAVASLTKIGWTSQQDVFSIGATQIPGGIQCTWGNLSVAGDDVQMYGWAPIDADTATAAQQDLISQGWRRLDESDGVYITEDSSTVTNPDDQGYGWTYQFGDGWVKFADTKQGLLLVSWPPAG